MLMQSATLVLLGAARALGMPANQAMLRNVVDDSRFGRALPVYTGIFHTAVVAGPVLGGFLYLGGPLLVHATVSACLAVSTCMRFGFFPCARNQDAPACGMRAGAENAIPSVIGTPRN